MNENNQEKDGKPGKGRTSGEREVMRGKEGNRMKYWNEFEGFRIMTEKGRQPKRERSYL